MLKIGKGLHKKKKSKKNKHKEDELFTEEELERYRKEHSQKASEEAETANPEEKKKTTSSEEFEKFKALTAGVDDILRKSQGDLDRIKKESFFQRKPTPSEIKAQEEKEKQELTQTQGNWIDFDKNNKVQVDQEEKQAGEVESESEYEFDDKDDIFDTAYVEALESGEVKLAYVSEDDEVADDGEPDPFDTTSAEEILRKVQQEEDKKKRQVSLGLAVQVLTGRADRDKSLLEETGAAAILEQPGVVTKPRQRPRKIQDFVLIGSFDEETPRSASVVSNEKVVVEAPKSLLDNDLNVDIELPEGDILITEVLAKQQKSEASSDGDEAHLKGPNSNIKDVVSEFDAINTDVTPEVRKAEEVEDQFDEFTALAASSVANQKLEEELQKFEDLGDDPFDTRTANIVLKEQADPFGQIESEVPPPRIAELSSSNQKWSAFTTTEPEGQEAAADEEEAEVDPFDTTFVVKIQPGKCELKLLESEILGDILESAHKSDVHQEARILSRNNSETDFPQPQLIRPLPKPNNQSFPSRVCIQITDPSGFVETQRGSESESRGEGDLVSLSYKHRDLLGGSTTDLTKLANDPLPPEVESPVEDFSKYSDPFDTSIVDQVALPGKAELKYIEKELLSDLTNTANKSSLSDDDFDPRSDENRRVAFDIPSPAGSSDTGAREGIRPLTPYCCDVRDSESDTCDVDDPFDTSHLAALPGKQELRLIEEELNRVQITQNVPESIHSKLKIVGQVTSSETYGLKHSSSADNFNTREEEEEPGSVATNRRFSYVSGFTRNPPTSLSFQTTKPDLLVVEEEHSVKALTPQVEEDISAYIDPFDTSIAENIVPGKAELKVLESELITELEIQGEIKRSYTDPDFDPRDDFEKNESPKPDILNQTGSSALGIKPLSPVDVETRPDADEDFDPFDTTIAANLLPGKAEIRIIESELFGQ